MGVDPAGAEAGTEDLAEGTVAHGVPEVARVGGVWWEGAVNVCEAG